MSTRPECLPVISDSEVVRRQGVVGGDDDGFEVRVPGECVTGVLAG